MHSSPLFHHHRCGVAIIELFFSTSSITLESRFMLSSRTAHRTGQLLVVLVHVHAFSVATTHTHSYRTTAFLCPTATAHSTLVPCRSSMVTSVPWSPQVQFHLRSFGSQTPPSGCTCQKTSAPPFTLSTHILLNLPLAQKKSPSTSASFSSQDALEKLVQHLLRSSLHHPAVLALNNGHEPVLLRLHVLDGSQRLLVQLPELDDTLLCSSHPWSSRSMQAPPASTFVTIVFCQDPT